MKRYYTILLFFLLYSKIVAQVSDDTSNIHETPYNQKLENLNFSDTVKNSFAKYLIKSEFSGYKLRQKELKESPMIDLKGNKKNLFRILNLPSFNHPICFTIVSVNEKFYVYWSMGKGSGGYEPEGIKKKGKTKISKKDWEYFLSLIDAKSIDTLPLCTYKPMCDGTSWIVEKNIGDNYKIHFTNYPTMRIEDAFAWLSHISKVRNKETINFYGPHIFRFFDKNNEKIDLHSLRSKVIEHLNTNFYKESTNKEDCFDYDIYIRINSRGKIKTIKYAPEFLPFRSFEERYDYFEENFQDRKFRRALRKCLNNLNLTYLNLSESIKVPVYIKYNQKTKQLEMNAEY